MSSSLLSAVRVCVALACTAVIPLPRISAGDPATGAGIASLSPSAAQARLAALREEIARHDDLYFRKAAPEISDTEYDRLKQELRRLETAFPELAGADASRAAAPGDDRTGAFPTHRHREPMLSLEKAYSAGELRAFHERLAKTLRGVEPVYVIEPKVDGLAVSITFEHGKLVRALTRGNGTEGDDVTANVLTIAGLPRELRPLAADRTPAAPPASIELRGEVYVSFAEFRRINAEREAAGEPPFANPRNLAAGTLKQLDPHAVAARRLEIVFFGCGAVEPENARPATQHALHEQIAAWGLPGVSHHWRAGSLAELRERMDSLEQMRRELPYPIDGAVVKLDSTATQRDLGASRTAPHWALAYKFRADQAETRVLAIELQVGRSGVLTPVARLAPVELGGSTISRATLHNADEIARLDVREGDTVVVEKAGEIIPAIVSVNLAQRPAGSTPFAFPAVCPACAGSLRRSAGEVAIRCPNIVCPAQLQRRIEHFASRQCVDIKGLGSATIEALVASGRLHTLADLYRLRRDDLLASGRGGEKTADALLAAIETSRRAELWRFIHGLGIPGVGAAGAQALAKRFATLPDLANATPREDATAAAFFAEPANRALIADLAALGVQPRTTETVTRGHLSGRTFVLTGTLPSLRRAEAVARIEAAGGQVSGRVNERTDYVVVGAEPGAKRQQALKAGIPVLDEADLLRLLEDGPPAP